MTQPIPRPAEGDRTDRSTRRRAARLVTGLLLLSIGMGGGLGAGLLIPRAVGADPSPAVGPIGQPPAGFDVYQQALDVIRQHYVDRSATTDQNLLEGSIRGMVDALGDTGHTVYLTADELAAENDALDGTVTGIGVSVDARGGGPVIISVVDGSPADRAGLHAGDTFVAVDGVRVDRATVDELVRRVRGEPGTTVDLTIRSRDGSTRVVTIERARIDVPPVDWAFVPGTKVAVIRLVQFSSGAAHKLADAARAALAAEASSVVLDLRGNPGGLLDQAVAIASVFLQDGVVYRSENRDGEQQAIRTDRDAIIPDLPLVVLVDYGSASSAEIVTAALQDAGRATVVGERTYGTGTVLNVFDLSDGSAIRLGVERWLTPEGKGVFDTGIAPDVTVTLPVDGVALEPGQIRDLTRRDFATTGDTQLRRAVKLLTDGRA